MQDGQEASDRLRRRAEQQRDSLDNQFRFAQTHTEELLKTIAGLEQAKHKIEQQAQEDTLQLRQRLLEQAQSSQVCVASCSKKELTLLVTDLLVEKSVPACAEVGNRPTRRTQ